jgi:hypothetical protein
MEYSYGQAPEKFLENFTPDWHEYMHYLYLPVVVPGQVGCRLPQNLGFLQDLLERILDYEQIDPWRPEVHVYVTARRGFATPGNPLNRPGWHADGYGSDDINYIWSDRFPTRFATGDLSLPPGHDHISSVEMWTQMIDHYRLVGGADSVEVHECEPLTVYRLDPSVIHQTPIIPSPGGDRSFFKVSVSPYRYNLLGNSHNYLFPYDWTMHSRSEIRNDPAYAGGDFAPQDS